jgi:hypothetical protein
VGQEQRRGVRRRPGRHHRLRRVGGRRECLRPAQLAAGQGPGRQGRDVLRRCLADGRKLGVTEAKTPGCTAASALSCLRGKPVKDLLKIFPAFSDVLAYNTPLLPRNPATAVLSGRVLHSLVLSSGNHDEERAFVGGAEKVKPFFTAKTYPAYLKAAFGASAGRVARQYPLSKYPQRRHRLVRADHR